MDNTLIVKKIKWCKFSGQEEVTVGQ